MKTSPRMASDFFATQRTRAAAAAVLLSLTLGSPGCSDVIEGTGDGGSSEVGTSGSDVGGAETGDGGGSATSDGGSGSSGSGAGSGTAGTTGGDSGEEPPMLPPLSGDHYYVAVDGDDSNDGSEQRPWATLSHAGGQIGPGDTVHVAPGAYTDAVQVDADGIEQDHIRYISDVRWGAKIRTTGARTSFRNSGDYVEIIGFDVSGDGAGGISNGGSHSVIFGNHVHDIPAGGCDSNGGAGINHTNYEGADNHHIGNVVHDIGDRDNNPCARVQGIYHSNTGSIQNNIAYRNAGYGIHLWHAATDITISNNLSFNNGRSGLVVGAGDNPPGIYVANCVVTNNIFVDNEDRGWVENGRVGENNVYINNLVFGNEGGTFSIKEFSTELSTIDADPLFMNYQPDGGGSYRVQAGSPAIDAGTQSGAPPNDHLGAVRPHGNGIDIGPYEEGARVGTWPWPY